MLESSYSNKSASYSLCDRQVLVHETGDMIFSTSGLQWELSHLIYDIDQLHVCHATLITQPSPSTSRASKLALHPFLPPLNPLSKLQPE